MSQMFNIEPHRASYIGVADIASEDVASFMRNCLRSFKERIEPTLSGCEKLRLNKDCQQVNVVTTVPPPVIVIPKSVLCTLENRLYTGIYYAYLMTHPLHGKKTSANVGYSTNPMHDLYLHNNLLINDRTTSAAAPFWILSMVLGPFISVEKAMECSNEWVSNTRGIDSKRKRAVLLSRMYNVKLYSAHEKPQIPLEEYLAETAPSIYMDSYRRMSAKERKKK